MFVAYRFVEFICILYQHYETMGTKCYYDRSSKSVVKIIVHHIKVDYLCHLYSKDKYQKMASHVTNLHQIFCTKMTSNWICGLNVSLIVDKSKSVTILHGDLNIDLLKLGNKITSKYFIE